ncbi:MAG: energy transducer TonB, partial [Bacteroidota bacterium]|nr:energy transducer TonB [Bacteroidota bacterium]
REKSCPWAKFKLLLIIPAASLLCFGFAKGTKVGEISKQPLSGIIKLKDNMVPAVNSDNLNVAVEHKANKQEPVPASAEPVAARQDTAAQEQPYTMVEKMPEFPGGINALMKFLADNIKYPAQDIKEGKEGTVVIRFVVDKTGNVKNPEVLRSVNPEIDQEALRVVNLMPNWKPGLQKGIAVPVYFVLPVRFALAKEKSSK